MQYAIRINLTGELVEIFDTYEEAQRRLAELLHHTPYSVVQKEKNHESK
jgi:hypothetical protein